MRRLPSFGVEHVPRLVTAMVIGFLFAFLGSPAFADVLCASGNLSTIDNTTCDIASLRLQFIGTLTQGTALTDKDFTFTVLADGFELSGPGPQSVGAYDTELFTLRFNATDLSGTIIGLLAVLTVRMVCRTPR